MFLNINIGPDQVDEYGHHNRAIQHAIDCIANQRGGCVHLEPGEYTLRGPLHMRSEVHLKGSGLDTILNAVPFVHSPLIADADIGQKEIHPSSAEGFFPGSGLIIIDDNKGSMMAKAPICAQHIQDNIIYTEEFITNDWIATANAYVLNYFPHIQIREAHNVTIEDLTINQKRDNDQFVLEQNVWGAGIYSWRSAHIRIDGVCVDHAYGDGLRSGQSRDVQWLNCIIKNCTHYGVHPGSHTCPVKINHNEVYDNGSDGIYACWGVRHSEFCHNKIYRNGYRIHRNGFCIGHKDTDALVAHNHIYDNAKHGIHIREKTAANGAHRGRYEHNIIENNGRSWEEVPDWIKGKVPDHSLEGAGIFINGHTEDLLFKENSINNSQGQQKRGIYVGANVMRPKFIDNQIKGHEIDFDDSTT